MKKLVLAAIVGGMTLAFTACGGSNDNASSQSSASNSTATESVKEAKTWQTEEVKDEMTDEVSKVKRLKSDEAVAKGADSYIEIKNDKEAAILFSSGVTLSNLFLKTHNINLIDMSEIVVRFDGGEPQKFNLSTEDTQTSTYYRMLNPAAFIEKCNAAKEIKIQFSTHSDGDKVYTYTDEAAK